MNAIDPIVQEIISPFAPWGAWGMPAGQTRPVPEDFCPTMIELALLLRVRDCGDVEMREATRPLYARLERIGALRVDAGPTMRYQPYTSFHAALVADGR